ncbi:MAG TPA: PD-(D/E)XK nuclease family protein, partial [Solirubrobacteraceae bacterium]|nr:PD-(D/E)XK nuclease family protein [Solirubrobacteraceae bacterium]
IGWIAPAFGAELTQPADPSITTDLGAHVNYVSEADSGHRTRATRGKPSQSEAAPVEIAPSRPLTPPAPQVSSLSYSSLALYERCGYRFYVERILGLPPTPGAAPQQPEPTQTTLPATDRGTLAHQILQDLDLRRPQIPPDQPKEITPLIQAFISSEVRARLTAATELRREQRFVFPLGPALITGTFDVLATEPDGTTLVVDYKTDRLNGRSPAEMVAREYEAQRLIYALAALRAGAPRVEVVHLFLEDTVRPVSRSFESAELMSLQEELDRRAAPLLAGRFEVTGEPQRAICTGCPALGGLCSWPPEMAMRAAVDRLF